MPIVALTVAALTLLCTGSLTLRLFRVDTPVDAVARLGLAMATGLSVLPLLLEFLPNVHWTPTTVRLLFAGLILGWIAAVPRRPFLESMRRRLVGWYLVAVAFLAMIACLAIAQVYGVSVAPGVDSVHHLMLTRLIVDKGGVPEDLEPFIPGGQLAYHWGAHGNVAVVALLLGRSDAFDVSELIVWYTALLRVVCILTLYGAARSLFASRFAALMCGALAAGFSALPTELVTQGRFTHLAGVAVLPALLAVRPGHIRPVSRSIVTAILLAGVFLIQARLVVFGLAWIIVSTLFSSSRRPASALAHAALSLCLAGLLVLPWGLHLAGEPLVRSMLNGSAFAQNNNRWTQRYVPPELVWLNNNGLLLSGATAGVSGAAGVGVSAGEQVVSVGWLCVVLFAASRLTGGRKSGDRGSPRRTSRMGRARTLTRTVPWRPLALVLSWVVLSAVFLVGRSRGFDVTNVVPYGAGALTSFIPMILMTGGIVSWVAGTLHPGSRAAVATVAFVACTLTGIAQHKRYAVVSPLPDADRHAMIWITENISRTAQFAVMARPFHGVFVGEDAGYWLQVLTDRRSILPPLIYGWVSPASEVERTNELLRIWTTIHPDTSVPKLVAAGVTNAYIGSTAHAQARRTIRGSSRFKVIYDRDDVLIAELNADR